MHKNTFLHNIQTNVGYKVEGLNMQYYKAKGNNLIPPFMNFAQKDKKCTCCFYNIPVYDNSQAYKIVSETGSNFSYFCSGPFVNFDAVQQADYCLSLDDFFITSKKDEQSGKNIITFWDKDEIPEQIDYVHIDKPLKVSQPMFFKPLFNFVGLIPKGIELENYGKLTCRTRNITDGKYRIENLDDRIAFKLIQQMNFDTVSTHTANRFFYPNPEIRGGYNTQIIFKVGPSSYYMIIINQDCRGFIKIINYHPDNKTYTENEGEDVNNYKDLAVALRNIKNMRDQYVEKQYIH